jgi:hypothetical protein
MWVSKMEHAFPNLLVGDFPGKEQIAAKYTEHELGVEKKIGQEQEALNREVALHSRAADAMVQLEGIRPSHFRDALRRRGRHSPVPQRYLTGVYAPWEPMPDWFEDLFKEYGA